MELSDVIKLIDDVEMYSNAMNSQADKQVNVGENVLELSKRIIDFEKFLQGVGFEDKNADPDTVEDMIKHLRVESPRVFRWIKELGIEYFDWARLKGAS